MSPLDKDKQKLTVEVATASDVDSLASAIGSEEQRAPDPFHHESKLSSSLTSRHISMITLVGVFGTGLFLSSGGSLATAGPVGMFLAYVVVAIVVGASQMCITEQACLMPVTAGYVQHAEYFSSGALSFMLGWCTVYSNILPTELSATAVVMTYWLSLNPAVWITIYGLIVVAINSYNIKWYGEIEFFFGCLKIMLVVGLVIAGVVIDLGGGPDHDRLGFRYWKEPFNTKYTDGSLGQFLAFWKVLLLVVYAFGGVQTIALLAGEVQYPRRAIYRAGKRVFFRCFTMYLTTVFVLSLIVSSKNTKIASGAGNASSSPFVVAMNAAGIKVLPHIINGVVLTSALSAANLAIVAASRNMYALAAKGQAPGFFLRVNKHGMPYVTVIISCAFIPIAYLSVNSASLTVFSWFQGITSSNLLMSWIVISINHICMTRAMKVQGYSRDQLPYKIPGTQYASWFSLFMSTLFLLTGGFPNFIKGEFEFASFFSAYFIIPLALGLYASYAVWTRKLWLDPKEVDLEFLFKDVEARPEPPYPPLRGWAWLTLLYA